jgi:elongator complex protein 3
MQNDIKYKAIKDLLSGDIKNGKDLMLAKRRVAKKFGVDILTNAEILALGKDLPDDLRRLLRKRAVRTLSGIAPVAVLTMPYPCPGKCAYCPAEKDVPQSYLSNEPAVMRAIRCNYDPYTQVRERLRALEANGHDPTKIELIVIGGTWSVLPEKYKYWYIKECFRGANEFGKYKTTDNRQKDNLPLGELVKLLGAEQIRNEKAKYKIIGLTLETRPDYINEKELWQMREFGCTRVELGVQAVDDDILKLNKRGHGVNEIAKATRLLKNFGFKATYHLMPGLPWSSPAKDLKMFKQLFSDERFQPDQIKFYPTVVTKGSLLYRWWKAGKYKPYSDKVLKKLIIECKKAVPPYVRIIRLIRDIPGESIIAGNKITNLRQIMKDEGAECGCIRCREIKIKKLDIGDWILDIVDYESSGGREYFIQAISRDRKEKNNLLGFCRLFLAGEEIPGLGRAALLRELHVYGELVPVGEAKKVQHSGLGKALLFEAEKLAKQNGYDKMRVISGVGVRGYYRKLGYRREGSYMVKKINGSGR